MIYLLLAIYLRNILNFPYIFSVVCDMGMYLKFICFISFFSTSFIIAQPFFQSQATQKEFYMEATKSLNALEEKYKLKTSTSSFSLQSIEAFTKKKEIFATHPSAYISRIDQSSSLPEFSIFKQEIRLLSNPITNYNSLMLHTNFSKVRREKYDIQFKKPKYIDAKNVLHISLWVHSQNYLHELYVKVQSPYGKVISLNMGKLDWTGWKRMQIHTTENVNKKHRLERRPQYALEGFYIHSNPRDKNLATVILISNVSFLLEKNTYTKEKIYDTW